MTLGEPAGIGPDIAIRLAQSSIHCRLAVIGDPELLETRAAQLGLPITLDEWRQQIAETQRLAVVAEPLRRPANPGRPDTQNAAHVLRCLDRAIDGCMAGEFDAMVTGPVHKGIINEAGTGFTGHTEYISERTCGDLPVMLLASGTLRVALVTTHVALSEVSVLITRERVERVIRVLIDDLRDKFGITRPRIAVCGLNPHAGEQGHLGREEIEEITPAIEVFRKSGIQVSGPHPADTVFLPGDTDRYDVILAMYHDQGLPVLKYRGFSDAVNVTLGVPLIRTSVDHGTALELAGRADIDLGSARAALDLAISLAQNRMDKQARLGRDKKP